MLEWVTMWPSTSIETCQLINMKMYITLQVSTLHYVDIYVSLEVFKVVVDHKVIC
jgi:hypothetical protein